MDGNSKILFICDTYGVKMTANNICVKLLVNEIKQRGYQVYIVTNKQPGEKPIEIEDGVKIYRHNSGLYRKFVYHIEQDKELFGRRTLFFIRNIVSKIRVLLILPLFPLRNPISLYRYCKEAEKLCKNNEFERVIGIYSPLEPVLSSVYLKKKYDLKVCCYFLDCLSDCNGSAFLYKKFSRFQGRRYEKIIFGTADLILNLRSHENNFKQSFYDKYRDKMKIVDLPLLSKREIFIESSEKIKKLDVSAVYTGVVRTEFLNFIIKLFEKTGNINLNIYTRNDISKYKSPILFNHGYVTVEESLEAQNAADILISMGNKDSTYVPSKIFEYMSTGKKIIHFCFGDNDSCITYYEKYANALIININKKFETNLEHIKKFLDKETKIIPFSELENIFRENLPQLTVDMILNN